MLGKPPRWARSTPAARARRRRPCSATGAVVCARAVVLAGARARRGRDRRRPGPRARARRIGSGTVIGRGSAVDNDVAIGERVRVQTVCYLTASR